MSENAKTGENPWFTAPQKAGLLDFWNVYDQEHENLVKATTELVENHPDFGPLIRKMSAEQRAAQNADSRARLKRAVEGDWESYELVMRTQGESYAQLGISFRSWYDLMRAFHRLIIPYLVKAYSDEPDRLSAALEAMAEFSDQTMSVIASTYLSAKRRRLTEQQQIAEQRTRELAASEASFRQQSSILRSILDSMAEGVIVCDENSNLLMFNQVGRELLGVAKEEPIPLLNQQSQMIFYPDRLTLMPIEQLPLIRAVHGERVHDVELFIRNSQIPHGIRLSVNASPLVDAAGVLRGGVATFRDVSERLRLEEARRRSTELEAQNRRIQETSRLKSEFLSNMSHELRTPLNSIIGFAALLHAGAVPTDAPEHHEFLGDILTSGRHLLQLINDVLDLSKVESGKMDFYPRPVELAQILGEVINILRPSAAEKRIAMEMVVETIVAQSVIDPSRLKQVLYNYLSNALKFTPDGGRIWVRALAQGPNHMRLEVEDTGIGISQNNLGRLFVEFQQLDTGSSKQHGGTGLGLALTKRLVEAQGGTVGVESTLGKGSIFHACLLRVPDSQLTPETLQITNLRLKTRRILVIEDDANDREEIAGLLRASGYIVDTAETGSEALSHARTVSYEAITIDVLLPDMDGVHVVHAIRAQPLNQHVPIIVVTIVTAPGGVTGCAVVDILPKPVDHASLLSALRRAHLASRPAGYILVVDDDMISLRLMGATLGQLGHRTECYADANAALTAARESRPTAVVLDLIMPGMSGLEFLEQFRAMPHNREIPVIIWTVKDLSQEEHMGLRAAAHAVVQKGYGGGALIEELRTFLPAQAAGWRG